ncbi:MAG: hypothetical protein WDM88_06500 [Galbitalea sp.]
MATILELFYLVDAGEGRWVVRHQVTDELAGTIARVADGFELRNAESRPLGVYDSTSSALRSLYATV